MFYSCISWVTKVLIVPINDQADSQILQGKSLSFTGPGIMKNPENFTCTCEVTNAKELVLFQLIKKSTPYQVFMRFIHQYWEMNPSIVSMALKYKSGRILSMKLDSTAMSLRSTEQTICRWWINSCKCYDMLPILAVSSITSFYAISTTFALNWSNTTGTLFRFSTFRMFSIWFRTSYYADGNSVAGA